MAVAFVNQNSSNSEASGPATTTTVTKPTGVATDDYLLYWISFGANTAQTYTPPSGFTLLREISGIAGGRIALFTKVAGGSEPANYTLSWNNAVAYSAGILAYSGASGVDVHNGSYDSASASDYTFPTLTTSVANTMIVCGVGSSTNQALTPPSGMNERVDVGALAASPALEISDVLQAAQGSTGTKIATGGFSTKGGIIIALAPVVPITSVARCGMVGL